MSILTGAAGHRRFAARPAGGCDRRCKADARPDRQRHEDTRGRAACRSAPRSTPISRRRCARSCDECGRVRPLRRICSRPVGHNPAVLDPRAADVSVLTAHPLSHHHELVARHGVVCRSHLRNPLSRARARENIPATPSIILSKHESAWETLALQVIFPPQVWV